MKEYILNILDKLSIDDLNNENSLDIAFMQDEVQKCKTDESYYSKVLLVFDDNTISKIATINGEEDSFLGTLMYIKSLCEINAKENIEIPLSISQKESIGRFIYLAEQFVANYEDDIENQKKNNNKALTSLKKRLNKNKPLLKEDYSILEIAIKKYEPENANKKLDEVMSYLNKYNYGNIVEVKNKPAEPKKEVAPDEFDALSPQSFEFVKEPKQKSKKEFDLFKELGISTEDVFEGSYNILNNLDANIKKKYSSYIKKNKLTKESIISLINRGTSVFTKPDENFENNCALLLSYNADINYIIKENITFFFNTYEYNKNKISLLSDKKISVEELLKSSPKLLAIGTSKLINNIQILENYGFDLDKIDYDSLSILANDNLNVMLDFFIEAGFSDYVFSTNEIKNLKSLIIKRLYYSYKNELDIWGESLKNHINAEYNDYIMRERKALTEEEIRYLIDDYPILDGIEEGKRPILFNDATTAKVKRKYEFRFDNITISRLKTYSVFKVLVTHSVEERKALLYALTYNSNLDENDYSLFRKFVLGD